MTRQERQKRYRAHAKAMGQCTYGAHPTTPGYASCDACRAKYGRGVKAKTAAPEREVYERKVPDQVFTRRTCLKCDRPFDSWGAANRLCANCRHNSQQHDAGPGARPLPEHMHEIVNGWSH